MDSGNDSLFSIENATGSPFSDNLFGDDGPNILKGGDGGDRIEALEGDDTLLGEDGLDIPCPPRRSRHRQWRR
ncbi:MAG: hypothetical protein WEB00_09465 [Dehalococcoidia bacterium]